MKKIFKLLPLIALSLPLLGCGGFFNFLGDGRVIKASDTVVSETRETSGFTAVDMRGVGRIILSQGETESLEVSGSDNLVPLVKTSVQAGVLVIEMTEKVIITNPNPANVLTYTIGVKELTALTVSGLGDVEMDGLSASRFDMTISGTGKIDLKGLELEDLDLSLSGMGDVTFSGAAESAAITLSGAGNVNAGGFKLRTARITLSGAGNATLWVTGKLNGEISGAGNVEYYGKPETDVNTTGVGRFKSLGNK
jgi:hypothetical protein